MSRTWIHRPAWACFDDPSNCVEDHDHRDGPCDLPDLRTWRAWNEAPGTGSAGPDSAVAPWRCGWNLRDRRLANRCGCRLCTYHWERREDRRRDRRSARVWLATGAWAVEWMDGKWEDDVSS